MSNRLRVLIRTWFIFLVGCAVLMVSCGGYSDDDTITVQLDWTPNTNHIGIYVALAEGWYKDAGLKVKILPYSDVNPDTVVANGQADIGISFPANLVFSRAAGLDLVSVAAVLQRSMVEMAVLDSSQIQRPRDLDGKTYAGFGLPYEEPQLRAVIQSDGGRGQFTSVTLSTAAYEALYNGRADFTEIFTAWEGIEAQLRGIKLRTFRYDKYGVPDAPSVVLVARQSRVESRGPALQRFLEVSQRGYEYAAQNPDQASQIFLKHLPKGTFEQPELVTRSTQMLADAFVDANGAMGNQSPAQWQAYSSWLLAQNVVTDDKSKVVSSLPGGPLFTNSLLSPD